MSGQPETLRDLVAPEAIEVVMGVCLSYADMARTMTPPPHLTGRETLLQFAQMMESAMRSEFGEVAWDSFVRMVRRTATGDLADVCAESDRVRRGGAA